LASTAQQLILDRFAPACVVIDRKLKVLYVHGPVEQYLTFPPGELTTRVVDMAREGLRARLGGAIAECLETHRPVPVEARVRRGPVSVPVGATVSPLKFPHEIDGLLLIAFEDCLTPTAKPLRSAEGKNEFQQLQDELKVTREELQSTIAQLEGSNDQLKASNEEVTAANEELQSANEELETSKEELQSLNEELNTINARLEDKVEELEGVNNDLLNLLESTAIATVFLDKELKVKRYTPASTRLFSLIPTDLARPIADILRRFEDETLFGDAARVLADLTPLAKEVRAEDGRWYIRRITPYRTTDDRIEGIVVTFVDVCDIKRTEEALREAREQAEWLARMPGENPNPVARVSTDGFILYVNPAASQTPGWRFRVGRPVPEPLRAMIVRAAAEEKPVEEDVELGERPFSVTVVPVPDTKYVNVYGRDITERKKAEEALRRSEEEYRLIFETANEGIWITDGERKTTLVNRRMSDMLGYSREELLGREPAEFLNPDQKPVLERTRRAITEGSQTQQEFKFRRKDGSDLWVLSAASPVLDRDGRLIRTVSMLADVTARKRMEEELRASNDELEMFNRAAVGRELRMIDLKREVNALVARAGEPPRYPVESEDETP
jgi:two-component system CheB/CheR fusion protein